MHTPEAWKCALDLGYEDSRFGSMGKRKRVHTPEAWKCALDLGYEDSRFGSMGKRKRVHTRSPPRSRSDPFQKWKIARTAMSVAHIMQSLRTGKGCMREGA